MVGDGGSFRCEGENSFRPSDRDSARSWRLTFQKRPVSEKVSGDRKIRDVRSGTRVVNWKPNEINMKIRKVKRWYIWYEKFSFVGITSVYVRPNAFDCHVCRTFGYLKREENVKFSVAFSIEALSCRETPFELSRNFELIQNLIERWLMTWNSARIPGHSDRVPL